MALSKEEKEKIIKKFAQGKFDTGSPEVQIALLDAEVKSLKGHLDEHKGDAAAKRGLLTKIAKRRRLLRYLDSRGEGRYEKLIKALKIRK